MDFLLFLFTWEGKISVEVPLERLLFLERYVAASCSLPFRGLVLLGLTYFPSSQSLGLTWVSFPISFIGSHERS